MNAIFSRQAFQPAFTWDSREAEPAQFATQHLAGSTSRSRPARSVANYGRLRASPGGEYGLDGNWRDGGKFAPTAEGPPPPPSAPGAQQVESSGSYQPQQGGDEGYDNQSSGMFSPDEGGGGGMPMPAGGGQMPSAAAPPPVRRPLRERVINYHDIGNEPKHQVDFVQKAWLGQPTAPLPHPDDEHGWVQLGAGPVGLPVLLLRSLGSQGHQFGKWVGKGLAQAMGDDVRILGGVHPDKVFPYAVEHPEIQDYIRRHSEDWEGKSIAGNDSRSERTRYRALRMLADDPDFGQKLGHAVAEGLAMAMAPPPNPDLQFDLKTESGPPRLSPGMLRMRSSGEHRDEPDLKPAQNRLPVRVAATRKRESIDVPNRWKDRRRGWRGGAEKVAALEPVEPEIEDFGRGERVVQAIDQYRQDQRAKVMARRQVMSSYLQDKLGGKRRRQAESPLRKLPRTTYGYWVTPGHEVHVVGPYEHGAVAGDHFPDDYRGALAAGWVRIAPGGNMEVGQLDEQTKAIIRELAHNESLGDKFRIDMAKEGVRYGGGTVMVRREDLLGGTAQFATDPDLQFAVNLPSQDFAKLVRGKGLGNNPPTADLPRADQLNLPADDQQAIYNQIFRRTAERSRRSAPGKVKDFLRYATTGKKPELGQEAAPEDIDRIAAIFPRFKGHARLYRGGDLGLTPEQARALAESGEPHVVPEHKSFSTRDTMAHGFAKAFNRPITTLLSPRGVHLGDSPFGWPSKQGEVIIPRGSKVRILEVDDHGNTLAVMMPEDDDSAVPEEYQTKHEKKASDANWWHQQFADPAGRPALERLRKTDVEVDHMPRAWKRGPLQRFVKWLATTTSGHDPIGSNAPKHLTSGRDPTMITRGISSPETFRTGSGKRLVRKRQQAARGSEEERENFLRALGVPIPPASYPRERQGDKKQWKIADYVPGLEEVDDPQGLPHNPDQKQHAGARKMAEHVIAHAILGQRDIWPRNSGNTLIDKDAEPWYVDSGPEGANESQPVIGTLLDIRGLATNEQLSSQLARIEPLLPEALKHIGSWTLRRRLKQRFRALKKILSKSRQFSDAEWWQQQFSQAV